MDYYACQVKTELVSREPNAWFLRPENKFIITSFDHKANRSIIASSTVTVALLQLYATELIIVTLPNGEKEESCHITGVGGCT
jgi:hypothetical protein